ncbi:MAG TPA: adenylyl-sulfate kinase [Pyrinomonadaceae bacterium]
MRYKAPDAKGMYARARRGEITSFTGIDDPYEPPNHPEIRLETVSNSPDTNARAILEHLLQKGFLKQAGQA